MPLQTAVAGPVIVPGIAGVPYTCIVRAALVPAQLIADTPMVPDVNEELKFTVMDVVPCPLVIVAVAGTVQL